MAKVSRPCPCGSGKKYKNAAWKRVRRICMNCFRYRLPSIRRLLFVSSETAMCRPSFAKMKRLRNVSHTCVSFARQSERAAAETTIECGASRERRRNFRQEIFTRKSIGKENGEETFFIRVTFFVFIFHHDCPPLSGPHSTLLAIITNLHTGDVVDGSKEIDSRSSARRQEPHPALPERRTFQGAPCTPPGSESGAGSESARVVQAARSDAADHEWGPHWQITNGDLPAERWPSRAKLVIGKSWLHGIHCHDYKPNPRCRRGFL